MSESRASVELLDGGLMVRGPVNPDTVLPLRQAGERLITSTSGPLRVDLSGVDAAHSVLLSLLLCWQRTANGQQRSVRFTGIGERLHSLAALSGLDERLPGFNG